MRVGVLSDTHGLLRPEVLTALQGVDHILHAGDVGKDSILEHLRAIAPLSAIRGNVDVHGPCADLPATEMVTLGGVTFYMLHSLAELDIQPQSAGVQIVVSGHTHKAVLEQRNGVMYLNPGSVGPRRFSLPVTMAVLRIDEEQIEVDWITFNV